MRWVREPLVHFLVLGGALFGLSAISNRPQDSSDRHIAVSAAQIETLRRDWKARFGRPPDPQQLRGAIDAYVREEILCREAHARRADLDDRLVRTLLVQRMEFFAAGDAATEDPGDRELVDYVAAHPEDFREPGGRMPALGEIRDEVLEAWRRKRAEAAADAAYRKLRDRYRVTIGR